MYRTADHTDFEAQLKALLPKLRRKIMANKNFFWGMSAIILSFGLVVIGCQTDSESE
jgi:hypothetical protein